MNGLRLRMREAKFPVGRVVATPGALAALEQAGQTRHAGGLLSGEEIGGYDDFGKTKDNVVYHTHREVPSLLVLTIVLSNRLAHRRVEPRKFVPGKNSALIQTHTRFSGQLVMVAVSERDRTHVFERALRRAG